MDSKLERFLLKIGFDEKETKDFSASFFSNLVNDSENNRIIVTIKSPRYLPYKSYKLLFDKCETFVNNGGFSVQLSFEYEKEDNIKDLINELCPYYKEEIFPKEKQIIYFYTNQEILDEMVDTVTKASEFLSAISSSYSVYMQESVFSDNTILEDLDNEHKMESINYSNKQREYELDQANYHEVKIKDINIYNHVIVEGKIFKTDSRSTKKNTLIKTIYIADSTNATYFTLFEGKSRTLDELDQYEVGVKVKVKGRVTKDDFNRGQTCIIPSSIIILPKDEPKIDDAPKKRVELHLHTKMSTLDGVTSVEDYIKKIKTLGHSSFAITDHGVVQAFPSAFLNTSKNDMKVIYGCELYMVDTKRKFIYNPSEKVLQDATFVIFDTETTGLSCKYNRLIEFGAVKVDAKGQKIDEVDFFIKPDQKISKFSMEVSHISQLEADSGKPIKQALQEIKEFFSDCILVAHNAAFDYDFINEALANNGMEKINNPVIDTLELSRFLFPDFASYNEKAIARKLQIEFDDSTAHRANYDAERLSLIFEGILQQLFNRFGKQIKHKDIDKFELDNESLNSLFPYHVTAYAKNEQGIKDLYKLISISSTEHVSKSGNPVVTRDELISLRKNLYLGSACLNGEVFNNAMTKGDKAIIESMNFYDIIEVQPPKNYIYLIHRGRLTDEDTVKKILADLIKIAKKENKLICATGDVHYFSKEEKIFRDVMISAKGLKGVRHPLNLAPFEHEKDQRVLQEWYSHPLPNPDQEFLTTSEMKEQFSFLNDEKLIDEIVVENTNKISDSIPKLIPITQGLHSPVMPGSDEQLINLVKTTANQKYGTPLPSEIQTRLDDELNSIISHGYGVIYWLSSMIVNWTNKQGYIVGSRGSVGSSLVAMFSGISEVNPLPPHYLCPKCHHIEWADKNTYDSGFDLKPKACPKCGHELDRDGQNIPFEVFLGFKGEEKVPDIDLNFPSDYQDESMLHLATELNKTGNTCYRAGTIQATHEKQARGYVLGYYESLGVPTGEIPDAQLDYLASGCIDIRRSTGQHPGGIIVIPKGKEIYDFSPYQYPANNIDSDWKTTHFDFHAIHDNVLKFDALSHTDPCAVKLMDEMCDIPFTSLSDLRYSVDITDPKVVSVFFSPSVLNLKNNVLKQETGALGLPEFGTSIGRETLKETRPKTFADLVRICGLSHGTNVYRGNARELIIDDNLTLSDVICCRDDIMTTLINKYSVDNATAFKIMEIVRKGKFNKKAIGDNFIKYVQVLKDHKVPEYYIKSCEKIEYLFPKAHAVAYVAMACRCAWFKIYHPKEYYAAYFSLRTDAFDIDTMKKGIEACQHKLNVINNKIANHEKVDAKEKNLITTYEVTIEMYDRGIQFENISIEKSDIKNFVIDKETGKLIPPFITLDSLGETIAENIVRERNIRPFTSIVDLQERAHVNERVLDFLRKIHALDSLPESDQITLF